MNTNNIPEFLLDDDQIRALRDEALAASDHRQVDICNRALTDDTIDQDGNEIAFADWTREEARRACFDAIASNDSWSVDVDAYGTAYLRPCEG